jgi:NDMA-dependent alcohol dehydrogenase
VEARVKTKGALLWEPGTNSGWNVEEIELDPPKADEVLIKLAASGLCHSDAHLDTGDIPLPWAPVLGGHEGAGVVVEAGAEVHGLAPGDHVVTTFLPSCGRCRWCASGVSSLCDVGAGVLGGKAPDGTNRIHARGKPVGAMSFLGTFAPYVVAPSTSVIKIGKDIPLEKAALIGCGVPTGWGSAVHAAGTEVGDTVVVVGTGGVGINAVQGARMAGAANIAAVDPVPFKREMAEKLGATHSFADIAEATDFVRSLTDGQGADSAILTMDGPTGDDAAAAFDAISKGGTVVVTGMASHHAPPGIPVSLLMLAGMEKRIQGCLFGMCSPAVDILRQIDLYRAGRLRLDELITRRYPLESINDAVTDLLEGRNIRGVIVHQH